MEADGAEVTVPGVSHHGHGDSSSDAQGEERQGEALLGLASGGDSGGEGEQRCGEFGKLHDDSVGERRSNSAVTNTKLWVADHRGAEPCYSGGARDDGTATTLQSSDTLHPLHDSQARLQLREDVLALPASESPAVQVLCMDASTAQLERAGENHAQSWKPSHADIPEDTNYTGEEEAPGPVHSLPHDQGGNQCLRDPGEVRHLWRGTAERGSSRLRDGVQSIHQVEQVGQGKGDRQGNQGRDRAPAEAQGDDEGRDGRVRGVPEVPTVATTQTERGQEQFQQDGRMRPPEEEEAVLKGSIDLTKQAKRALHQAEAALRTAEDSWRELMSLVRTESDQVEPTGWEHFQQEVLDPKDSRKIKNSKALHKFASVLGTDKDQAKLVAEVFNPNRFGPRTKRHGLIKGESFDLELGMDLLDIRNQETVLEYLEKVQPGLTVISPPCTLYTILQNLNHARRTEEGMKTYLQRLRWAKVLLQFATKVAQTVMAYGGKFLIENPLTSKAWQEKFLHELMMKDEVILVATDQCMYGLESRAQVPQKKPTGFVTNSEEIAKELQLRCDGKHLHEQVLGSDQGGLRSRQTQVYPEKLVDAILRGYRRDVRLQEHEKVYWTQFADLQRGEVRHHGRQRALREEADEILVEYAVHALGEEEEDNEPVDVELPPVGESLTDQEDDDDRGRPLPRERPFTLPQLVRRAHEGLGHPSNDRLARILRNAKASPEAIKLAKDYSCSVCEKHQKVRPARNAAPPRMLQVNEAVGVDTVYLAHPDGKNRMALNIVDWASRFQMIVPLQRHTPGAARQGYLQWTKLFGPPEKLYTDLGKEFQGAFELGAEMDSTYIEPGALEMPTQRSITERAGKTFKEVFSRACVHYECTTHEEWLQLVDTANMTCNRLLNKSGYSPIQRVLGYSPRIPGGMLSGGGGDMATLSHSGGDVQIQQAQQMRLAAAKAFHEADCSQALKNALHAGPRPPRDFEPGQLVYFWRKGTDRPKKDSYIYWKGPARVVLTAPPSTVWINYKGYVVKAAPEHLRHATEEERFTLSSWIDDIAETRQQLNREPRRGYLDLTKDPFPVIEETAISRELAREAPRPRYRLRDKTEKEQVIFQPNRDEWSYEADTGRLVRIHHSWRTSLFHPLEGVEDCPIDVERIRDGRHTFVEAEKPEDSYQHQDDWRKDPTQPNCMDKWKGRTEFLARPEEERPGLVNRRRPQLEEEEERPVKRGRMEELAEESDKEEPLADTFDEATPPDRLQDGHGAGEDRAPAVVRGREDLDFENEEPRSKRMRTEFLEIYLASLDKAWAAKVKKEECFKDLKGERRGRFLQAIRKEIQNNMDTKAYKMLSPEESERVRREAAEKIVKSRFVLTEKNIEADDIEKAKSEGVLLREDGENSSKAKARHVMKGFSETSAEELETTTPQCGRETVLCVLQLLCSYQWTPGYLDFTQAFHSGDDIERTIYASQPHDCPLPGYQPRQLLHLLKTCYGLLDGPYAWYRHLNRVLTEKLGYQVSAADPCLYYYFNEKDELEGVIAVATDDLLHGGTEKHWERMQWLNKHYKLGKFSRGDGRFVGKEITCRSDGSFLVHQQLYAQKIRPIEITRERKKQRYAYCDEKEITQLRGLLGGLAWLSKETRPDLAGRVSILQQSLPHPYVQDIIEANVLAKEAVKYATTGLTVHPIPPDRLRVGTVSDASWGNVRTRDEKTEDEGGLQDFWEERGDCWIRHHRQLRRLPFHPASTPGGPNVYELDETRVSLIDGQEHRDRWNVTTNPTPIQDEPWCGQTIFFRKTKVNDDMIKEKFLQHEKLASQGGYITFFYDSRMETEEKAHPITVICWKSFRIRRCTVNTLSAECQAMIQGVGSLHWLRFMVQEAFGKPIDNNNWEQAISAMPCIAVTDSKSLYDTIHRCCNTSSHIEDKRTAIDVTILKRDFKETQGQVRWIAGSRMISDSLTKKMGSSYLRAVLNHGKWSLSEKGNLEQDSKAVLLLDFSR